MAAEKHTTDPLQLDLSLAPAEEWRPVVGYEGLYEVSNLGRVRSLDTLTLDAPRTRRKHGKVLRLIARKKKYVAVHLSKEGQITMLNVHTLVLTAFSGLCPDGYTCNHIDGNSLNNSAQNLEWVTPGENSRHAYTMGLLPHLASRGEENPQAKVTEVDVVAIRRMRKEGVPNKEIAQQFCLSPGATSMIATGKTWKHVQ